MYNCIVFIYWVRVIIHFGLVLFLSNYYTDISSGYQKFIEFILFIMFIMSLVFKALNIAYCTNAYNSKLTDKDYESISFHILSGTYNWIFINRATILVLKCGEIFYCVTYFSLGLPIIMLIDLLAYIFKSKMYSVVSSRKEFIEYRRQIVNEAKSGD